jgi:serine/threonine protein phosphatase PrpC
MTAAQVQISLKISCMLSINAQVENELKENPRMKIEKGVKPFDESGSTCVVSVITSSYIAISNIGDSRAVLARKETKLLLG